MNRSVSALGAAVIACYASAQFPLTRIIPLLDGQRSIKATCITQDHLGLIHVGSADGIFRTDGDRTDPVFRTEGAEVTALDAGGRHVYAALSSGTIVRCDGNGCDTLWSDTLLRAHPVRSLLVDPDGAVWAGSYGMGVLVWRKGKVSITDQAHGLPDDHVNGICSLPGGRVAVGTDQGIAIVSTGGQVSGLFGEEQGAPDNLITTLYAEADGRIWAGGDRGGVFAFDPAHIERGAERLDTAWRHGAVQALAATPGRVWAGTGRNGLVACDLSLGLAYYEARSDADGAGGSVTNAIVDRDGAVWWCDGGNRIRRADPDVLVTPAHEGANMRHITALARERGDRIAFAAGAHIYSHASTFVEEQRFERVSLPIDSTTAIVALHTDANGTMWAGTFGAGVFRSTASGGMERFQPGTMAMDDNVLAIRSRMTEVWFATLDGVYRWNSDPITGSGSLSKVPIPGSGFTFDVLPMADGTTLVATDGNGVVRIAADGSARQLSMPDRRHRTFYILTVDSTGQAWTIGPQTGVVRIDSEALLPMSPEAPTVMEEVFAMVPRGRHLLVLGSAGLFVFDPVTASTADLTSEYGLDGAQAELNTACLDRNGSLWFATDKGLYRISREMHALEDRVATEILMVSQAGVPLPLDQPADLAADRDFITFRFTGLHFAATSELRFAYRLAGRDTLTRLTRDREVTFTDLAPGSYTFQVSAFSEDGAVGAVWRSFDFRVLQPWWRTPWALASALVLALIGTVLVIRYRDARIRAQERAEQEKVRFQMQVIRSQVNPHFLFNSLNTLIALIEEDAGRAVKHVEHLSDYFREILRLRDKDLIPLRDELRLVDTYFFLEQRRFGDRIRLRTSVSEPAMDALVPPLTVQLLVENALKHNRATDEEPLVVTIQATRDRLSVVNPYRPRASQADSTGFGLESIRQRFTALSSVPTEIGLEGDTFVARIPLIQPGA